MKSGIAALVLFVALSTVALAQQAALSNGSFLSATIARDINGFYLGQPIDEVRQRVQLIPVGGGDFDAVAAGVEYDFGFTPLGRLYRVGMRQSLGIFILDETFIQSLEGRLLSKYGQPMGRARNPWFWGVTENVRDEMGNTTLVETNWFVASVSQMGGDITLKLKMLDFRLLWADVSRVNSGPRNGGLETVEF